MLILMTLSLQCHLQIPSPHHHPLQMSDIKYSRLLGHLETAKVIPTFCPMSLQDGRSETLKGPSPFRDKSHELIRVPGNIVKTSYLESMKHVKSAKFNRHL
jgi:hypothetical protein